MEEKDTVLDKKNIQAELLFVGSFYKSPELYLTYGGTTKSKYDLSDSAMRFFYDLFEDYYLTFSQDFSENKMNGIQTIYFPSGQLQFEKMYKDGIWTGDNYKEYDENGNMLIEIYNNG